MKNIKNSRFNNLIRRKTNEDELDYDLEENSDEQSDDKIGESKDPKVKKAKKVEIKNLRQIGYGAAGLTIGVIAYLLLSASAPTVNDARSTISEFTTVGQSSGYEDEFGYEGDVWNDEGFDKEVVVDEDYTGDVVPLHPFGSYRVTRAEFDEYERNETVRYGKVNPTFYFDMPAATPEDEEGQEETTGIRSGTNITNVEVKDVDDSDIDIKKELAKIDTNNDGTITIAEAEAAGYSMPIKKDFWLYKYMSDRDGDGQVGESSSNIDDAAFNTGGRSESIISGFNIHTTKTEEYNVTRIREQFAKHAVLPVDAEYFNISSTYGIRIDPFTKGRAFHAGVDFSKAGINGSNIYAVMGGKITEAVASTSKDGLGNYVVIDHGEFHTLYAHMTDGPTLEVGNVVQAGDIVGTVGNTGRSTGPHLHFEVGVGGVKFDGLEFLIHIVDKDNNGHVTVEEAKQAGFTGDIDSEHWLYSYMTKGK